VGPGALESQRNLIERGKKAGSTPRTFGMASWLRWPPACPTRRMLDKFIPTGISGNSESCRRRRKLTCHRPRQRSGSDRSSGWRST